MAAILSIGERFPDLQVQTTEGLITSLVKEIGSLATLVSFIHGTWCAKCVNQLYSLQRHRADIIHAGAQIVVVTHEALGSLTGFLLSAKPMIEYRVLADPDSSAHQAVGAAEDTVEMIVDSSGLVRWSACWVDHRDHPGYQAMVQIFREIEKNSRLTANQARYSLNLAVER